METMAQLEDQELPVEQALQLDQLLMDPLDSQEVEVESVKHPEVEFMALQEQHLKFQQVELLMDKQALQEPHMVRQEADTELLVNLLPLKLEELPQVEPHTDKQPHHMVNQDNFQGVVLLTHLNQALANPPLEVYHTDKPELQLDLDQVHMHQLEDIQDNTEALEPLELVELEQSVELLDHQPVDLHHQVIQA